MRSVLVGRVVALQGAGKRARIVSLPRYPARSAHSPPGGLWGCKVMERCGPRAHLYSDCDSMSDPSILLSAISACSPAAPLRLQRVPFAPPAAKKTGRQVGWSRSGGPGHGLFLQPQRFALLRPAKIFPGMQNCMLPAVHSRPI